MALAPVTSVGGSSSSVTLLSSTTLSGDGTFDLTAIDQTYNDLIVVLLVRSSAAAAGDNLKTLINNDTGANYDVQALQGASATASAVETFAASSLSSGNINIVADNGAAGLFDAVQLELLGYASTTWQKTVRISMRTKYATTSGNLASREISGYWRSTVAISRLTFSGTTAANLKSGSVARLYGRL